MTGNIDVEALRAQFPALAKTMNGEPVVYFDGPAGSQVPSKVIDAITNYLTSHNANHGGPFLTSSETDAVLHGAHEKVAMFLGADTGNSIAFGANMTSLTLSLSRALARTWQAGDEIIVSWLDHDANVTPWVLAAQDAGVEVHHIEVDATDCTLDFDDYRDKLCAKTKLVAVGLASNATGTINPVQSMICEAHAIGALTFIDAVHYAPHGLIDVSSLDCDFLACSAYKFFGPHVGILYGKEELLTNLQPYKLRPATDDLPSKWMNGTQNHECIAGVAAGIDYLVELGRSLTDAADERAALKACFDAIVDYETSLAWPLIEWLSQQDDVRVWGITDRSRSNERVPTISFTHTSKPPQQIAERLAEAGIFAWPGNHYALPFTEAMGLEPDGTLRVGLLHYNTKAEVQRLIDVLETIL
ncbi:MAG: cysteine desulfurase-like protein [Planctomycetaceae bacterium]|nr:cysteine desulfurase-like protein [Planctomycetaceae bacterium]